MLIHTIIHSFIVDKYLFHTCYMPATARNEGDIAFSRSDSGSVLSELIILERETYVQYVTQTEQ